MIAIRTVAVVVLAGCLGGCTAGAGNYGLAAWSAEQDAGGLPESGGAVSDAKDAAGTPHESPGSESVTAQDEETGAGGSEDGPSATPDTGIATEDAPSASTSTGEAVPADDGTGSQGQDETEATASQDVPTASEPDTGPATVDSDIPETAPPDTDTWPPFGDPCPFVCQTWEICGGAYGEHLVVYIDWTCEGFPNSICCGGML